MNKSMEKREFKKNVILLNIDTKEKIKSNLFSGINIRDYEIYIPKKETKFYKKYENKFYISDMYESICIYESLSMKEIESRVLSDKIELRYFVGNSGKIKGLEIKNTNAKKN